MRRVRGVKHLCKQSILFGTVHSYNEKRQFSKWIKNKHQYEKSRYRRGQFPKHKKRRNC